MDQLTNIEHQQIRTSRRLRLFRIQHHNENQHIAIQGHVFVPWIRTFAGMTTSNIATIFKPVLRANAVLTRESADSLDSPQFINAILQCDLSGDGERLGVSL